MMQSIYPAYNPHIPILDQLGNICAYLFIQDEQNGALNIIRKVAPGAFAFFFQKDGFAKGVEGVVVRPLPLGIN